MASFLVRDAAQSRLDVLPTACVTSVNSLSDTAIG
jgi:hypothetical protein